MQTFFRTLPFVALLFSIAVAASAKSPVDTNASPEDIANRNAVAYPQWRLEKDWMYQDYGIPDEVRWYTGWRDYGDGIKPTPPGTYDMDKKCFCSSKSNETETRMIKKVIEELKRRGVETDEHEKTLTGFLETKKPGNDPVWKEFYLKLCEQRRKARLSVVLEKHPRQYVYAKHHVFGDYQAMFMMTTHMTDADFRERGPDYQMGSELCLMTINDDGTVTTEILYDCPTGVLRDPVVSFDGKRIAFSMRHNDVDDDFHLYVMELPERKVRQITFGPGIADMEPCYLPNGDIIFESTRVCGSAPCWWSNVTNLYACDGEGRYIRRLSYDHAHSVYPQLQPDGRITYTRWEYNDRHAGAIHPAMVMNVDGTNQTMFYKQNEIVPVSLFHIRHIPGTGNSAGIIGGHHVAQHGKLVTIDRNKGTDGTAGLMYAVPKREMPDFNKEIGFYDFSPKNANAFGQYGELFQYPFPLDELNYVVAFLPERVIAASTYPSRGPYPRKFGLYWMDANTGDRELLIYDPTISSGQPVALTERQAPPMRPAQVNLEEEYGTFYLQDVYVGPSMEGVERGAVKKLRIVGLDGRAAGTTQVILHPAGGRSTSAIGINNASYDVKHVLGAVDVEDDGSAYFKVPARTPIYFQLLDDKGRLIQTMRSWTVMQPGETLSCVGCHEDKNTTFISNTLVTKASRKKPQDIQPFFKAEDVPVQEQIEFFTESERKAYDYLGINAPQGEDVPTGFSYRREVQPIWDAHCIQCHTGTKNPEKPDAPFSLLGDSEEYDYDKIIPRLVWKSVQRNIGDPKDPKKSRGRGNSQTLGRDFSESYLNLTDYGFNSELVNMPLATEALAPNVIPPYFFGTAKSKLMDYLEPSHYGVQLTADEKDRIGCWIDLVVPYCGSWLEANTWDEYRNWFYHRNNEQLRGVYLYNELKRLRCAEVEIDHLEKYKEHLATGKQFSLAEFKPMEFGGRDVQKAYLEQFKVKDEQVPIHGIPADLDSRGGTTVANNSVRNLALNPYATTHQIRSYPHATSNSHHKYRAENSPKNLIDGNHSQDSPLWCPDPRTDLWVQVDFGREVTVEKTVLYLKVFPGAEKTWTNATLSFSDGSKLPIMLRHIAEAQEFDIPTKRTRFVKLEELKETFPLGRNGIVEWEIFGKD